MGVQIWPRRPAAPVAAFGVLALLLLLLGAGSSHAATHAATRARATVAKAPATLEVGSQRLSKCATAPLAYCGSLRVPLDYASADSPRISIAYRWYPATGSTVAAAAHMGKRARTVVPVEGGPGYPSIGSVSYRSLGANAGYAAMYGPLLKRWNMLAVDNRGTGESAPLECAALQRFAGPTGTEAFRRAAARCGQSLDRRWRYKDGSAVHASDLFGSIPAARDLAAVIGALRLPKVDLYGDSYGSFFAQVFAARFARLVRSVVLDSTYPAHEADPWYRATVRSMPADFDAACARSPACAQAASGPSWSRIGELARSLEASAVSGRVPGPSGALVQVKMDVVGLVDLLSDAAADTKIYRELDAAARALLGPAHDAAPLLRLYAQREAEDEGYFSLPASEYSVELYVAVACTDYPQLFDMNASPAKRGAELTAAEAALRAATFAPFSTAQWIAQDENTQSFSVCLGWPSPAASAETPVKGALARLPPRVPVLVLGGELDSWTPPLDAPKVLAQVGGKAQFVELANSTHVLGEGDSECGSTLIRRFVATAKSLDAAQAACAGAVPPIHTVGSYPSKLAEQAPLRQALGGKATTEQLQLAAAAVATAGDAIVRYDATEAKRDHGLAGGAVIAAHEGARLTLKRDALIRGVAVSGTVRLAPSAIASDGQEAIATLSIKTQGLPRASLKASWTTAGANAHAQVLGTVGKQPVAGTMPAP
ncbi:MAG TPA: alpha/beta fold hydrolase [Solirubrobacteraceae bacterium]